MLCLLGTTVAFSSKGAEYSPSVVVTNLDEMGGPCLTMVQNALQYNAKSIKFVPTVHYWGSEKHIDSFCYR